MLLPEGPMRKYGNNKEAGEREEKQRITQWVLREPTDIPHLDEDVCSGRTHSPDNEIVVVRKHSRSRAYARTANAHRVYF